MADKGKFTPIAIVKKRTPPSIADRAYEYYKESVPLEKRMYLQTLLGDRTKPFTAADLTDKELDIIGETIKASRKSRADEVTYQEGLAKQEHKPLHPLLEKDKAALKAGVGNVVYDDYLRAAIAADPTGGGDDAKYYPIWNSLGRFNYSTLTNGDVAAKDMYDFYNENRAANVQKYEQMNDVERLLAMFPHLKNSIMELNLRPIANAVGEAYIGRDGKPVNIVIPKDATK